MNTNANVPTSGKVAKIRQRLWSVAPIAISLLALAISSSSLFLTQLQSARIQVHPGEFAYVGSTQSNLEFYLNLTFANNGAALGVVRKVAILIHAPGKSDGYLLQAAYFDKLDDEGNFARESVVGPIPVDGRRTVSRQIRFISARGKRGDRPLSVRGDYRATVLAWTSMATHPTTTASFPFVLSDRDLEDLEAQRLGKLDKAIELHHAQFHRWSAGAMNEQEIRDLLRGKR